MKVPLMLCGLWAVALSVGGGLWAQPEVEEEEPEVVGVEASRPGGGFYGMAIEGNAFVLRFYDEEKKQVPVPPDVARAVASWNAVQKAGRQRIVLNPTGQALISPARVLPPHAFIAYVTLLAENGDAQGSVSFNMRQLMATDGE